MRDYTSVFVQLSIWNSTVGINGRGRKCRAIAAFPSLHSIFIYLFFGLCFIQFVALHHGKLWYSTYCETELKKNEDNLKISCSPLVQLLSPIRCKNAVPIPVDLLHICTSFVPDKKLSHFLWTPYNNSQIQAVLHRCTSSKLDYGYMH